MFWVAGQRGFWDGQIISELMGIRVFFHDNLWLSIPSTLPTNRIRLFNCIVMLEGSPGRVQSDLLDDFLRRDT